MVSAEAIIELFALVAAVIFGYFQIIVPFMRGEVRLTRQWPFVEDVKVTMEQGIRSLAADSGVAPDKQKKESRMAHAMFADMLGYIPMKIENDSLAQELLEEYVRILKSLCEKHGGKEINAYGDEFLIEFATCSEAALCAVQLQKAMNERNAGESEERKIQVRIGIHSGEVEHQEGEVVCETYDIVQRVERLSVAGGICVTDSVYHKVRNKIGTQFIKLGRVKKEIKSPIAVYKMIMPWEGDRLTYMERFSMRFQRTGNRVLTSISIMLFLVVLLFVGYLAFSEEVESGETIPIAVVDFVNQTGEKELDGLSGMLITALEQSRRLSVLTRSRMFDILKGLGREGVEHIDESLGKEICVQANLDALVIASIRKFGTLYSIDLKVLDPDRNVYIFTAKEEGEGQESIPSMMDRLSEKTRIGLKEKAEEIRLSSRRVAEVTTPNLEAYQHYFQGEELINHLRFRDARDEFRKAIALDSTFALAHYRLAYAYGWEGESIAKETLQKAVDLIDRIPDKEKYYVRAEMARLEGGFKDGVKVLREMEEIYPNDKEMIYNIGDWSFHENRFEIALEYIERVLEIDPTHERALMHLAWTYAGLGRMEEMGETARLYSTINEIEGSGIMGQYYTGVGEYPLAESTYVGILDKDPEQELALMRLALLYGEVGKYDKLLEYAQQYAEVGPSRLSSQILGFAYLANGNDKKAMKKFEKARELAVDNYEIPLSIAFLHLRQGRVDRARDELEPMIAEDQPHLRREQGYNGLITVHVFLGEYRKALELSDELNEIQWEGADTTGVATEHLRKAGLMWHGWKDQEGATAEIDKAIGLEDYVDGLGFRGSLSFARVIEGKYTLAEEISEEHLSAIKWFDPFLRFFIHSQKKEYAEAELISNHLLAIAPGRTRVMIDYIDSGASAGKREA